MDFISKNEKETLAFAENFVKGLKGGEVIGLTGELGAGKTVFAKGLAKGLGIKKNIQSPTFLLMKIYDVKTKNIKFLIHVDAYRLNNGEELIDIGIMDWLGRKDTISVIEWIEKVPEVINKRKFINIKMDFRKEEDSRAINIESNS